MREQPVQIVSDGVVTRSVRTPRPSSARPRRSTAGEAAPDRRYHPARPQAAPGRPQHHRAGQGADAEVTELTLKTARHLEELGHTVTEVDAPVPDSFPEDFLLYWSTLAMFLMVNGRRLHGRTFDRTRHDNLTLGLALNARRNLRRIPARDGGSGPARPVGRVLQAVRRLADPDARRRRPHASATSTPPQDYDTVIDRLLDWVAFTPLQNVTGDPAISLPMATTSGGLPWA